MGIPIADLDVLAAVDVETDDVLPIVDVHDLDQSPEGSTKKITLASLFTDVPDPSFTGTTTTEDLHVEDDATIDGTLTATVLVGNGAALTDLDADALTSGTVSNDRIVGTYTDLTGTGALDDGSITSGFGSINVGSDPITGGTITGTVYKGAGAAPTPALGTGIASASITGTNAGGYIDVTTDGGGYTGGNTIVTVTFSVAYATAPSVQVGASGGSLAASQVCSLAGDPTTALFNVRLSANVGAATTFRIHYQVFGV